MASKIILSYRRADALGMAGRIFDRLSARYGPDKVFMDIDSIPVGFDFEEHLDAVLTDCEVLLALIGPNWIGRRKGKPPRIQDEDDWVRLEVERALDFRVPLIPVLIEGAALPRRDALPPSLHRLLRRNALVLDSGRDFHAHVDRLVEGIDVLSRLRAERGELETKSEAGPATEAPSIATGNAPAASAQVHVAAANQEHDAESIEAAEFAAGSPSLEQVPDGFPAAASAKGFSPDVAVETAGSDFEAAVENNEQRTPSKLLLVGAATIALGFALLFWFRGSEQPLKTDDSAISTVEDAVDSIPSGALTPQPIAATDATETDSKGSVEGAETAPRPASPEPSPATKVLPEPGSWGLNLAEPGQCRNGPYIVFFDWGRTTVNPNSATILDNFVTTWRDCRSPSVDLMAHTDGSYSASAANRSIRSYLIGKGIPASVISTSSAGASATLVETADGVRELQNRRVEITTR